MVLPFRRGHRRHPLVARDSQERNPCGSSSHRADDRNGPHHLVTARLSPREHEVSLTAGADDRAGSATVTIQVAEP
jgi:hypothetical protein